jgi:hypothetical protein
MNNRETAAHMGFNENTVKNCLFKVFERPEASIGSSLVLYVVSKEETTSVNNLC